MKFNLETPVLDYGETPIVQGTVDATTGQAVKEPVNLRHVINALLNNDVRGSIPTSGDQMQIYLISVKIWDKSWKPNLTHTGCTFIRARALATLRPLLRGRLDECLKWPDPEGTE